MGSYCHTRRVWEGLWLAINHGWIFWEPMPQLWQSLLDPTTKRESAEIFELLKEVSRHIFAKLPNFWYQIVCKQKFRSLVIVKSKLGWNHKGEKLEKGRWRRAWEKLQNYMTTHQMTKSIPSLSNFTQTRGQNSPGLQGQTETDWNKLLTTL